MGRSRSRSSRPPPAAKRMLPNESGRDGAVQADGRPIERSHEQEGGAKRGDEHDEGRRKQAPGSACVERQQADPPGSLVLAQRGAR